MNASFRRKLLLLTAVMAAAISAHAAPLDPLAYTSLGALDSSGYSFGSISYDASKPTLTLSSSGGSLPEVAYTGVYVSQGAGLPNIAVFDFSSVTITPGFALGSSGTAAVAVLSRSSMTIGGTISLNNAVTSNPGNGANSTTGGGGGGGFGGGGGGGGANNGGPILVPGGVTYGNLALALQGGSAGGRGGYGLLGVGKGPGGGLKLGAETSLTLASGAALHVDSGVSVNNNYGGNSGGGLLLHANTFDLSGALTATGSAGGNGINGNGGGGGGGGGRVLINLSTYTAGTSLESTASLNVAANSSPRGGATVTYYGAVTNASGAAVKTAVGSATVFLGSVTGTGAFTGPGVVFFEGGFAPTGGPEAGGTPASLQTASVAFAGDVSFGGDTLTLDLGGPLAGSGYDQLVVAGTLTLDGTLEVDLVNGFNVAAGEQFKLLGWNAETGTFSALNLPTLPAGLSWDTSALYTTGILSVVPEPATWALLGVGAVGLGSALRRRSPAQFPS